ncbi:MAG: hypothetical protein LAT84_08500 [Balneolia bacterium]|nr:hypothetical protein [Balneolia bacterium]
MFDESKAPDLEIHNGQMNGTFRNDGKSPEQVEKHYGISRAKHLCELSCNILSLSFLEDEEEIYTLDDLKEKY